MQPDHLSHRDRRFLCLEVVARHKQRHVWKGTQVGDLLEHLVCCAIRPNTDARVTSSDFYVDLVIANTDAELIGVAQRTEGTIRGKERNLPAEGKTSSDRRCILFGDTDREEAVGESLFEQRRHYRAGDITAEDDDVVVSFTKHDESFAEALAGRFHTAELKGFAHCHNWWW